MTNAFTRADIGALRLTVTADTLTQGQAAAMMRAIREWRKKLGPQTDVEWWAVVVLAGAQAGWIAAPAPETITEEAVTASLPAVLRAWSAALNAVYAEATEVDPKPSPRSSDTLMQAAQA